MSTIILSGGFSYDLEDLNLPQPPAWYLAERTAPAELDIGEETEKAIRRYCYAIAMDDSSHARALLHKAVCELLGMDHWDFLPFEDDRITKIPTPNEALSFFFEALKSYRHELAGGEMPHVG